MAGIPEGWEPVASDIPDGWEAVSDEGQHLESVNGVPTYAKGAYKEKPKKGYDINDRAIGLGEAGLQIGSGLLASTFGPIHGMIDQLQGYNGDARAGETMRDWTYQPRTDKGQEYSTDANDAIMNLLPLAGIHLPTGPSPRATNKYLRSRMPEMDRTFPSGGVPPGWEPVQPDLFSHDNQGQGTNPYIPHGADMRMDENGMPYRQALSEGVEPRDDLFSPDQGAIADQQARAAAGRQTAAQATIVARQAAMEQQMRQSRGLDFNAAERARQEAAPVPGMEDARAREAQDAAQRTQPYMDERNQGLIDDTDRGYVANQYGGGQDGLRIDEGPMGIGPDGRPMQEPGMPIRADRSMEAANLENPLQRNLWGDELPRQSAQEAPRGITAAIDRMPPGEARTAGINMLNGKQRGAIDLQGIKEGISKLKAGLIDPDTYLGKWNGAFSNQELEFMHESMRDPKSRTGIVLMSPDEFHKMAEGRSGEYMSNKSRAYGPEGRRSDIRQGLKSAEGLSSIPQLKTITTDGVAKVWFHEGRHRMDVFKEMGLEKVPVLLEDATHRWGENPNHPSMMRGEDGATMSFPEVLNRQYTPEGRRVPQSQRGAIDLKAFHEGVQRKMDQTTEVIDKLTRSTSPYKPEESVVLDALGTKSYVARPDPPAKMIADSLAEGKDGPNLWKQMQSGLQSAGDKVKSSLMVGVARWISYADKMGDRYILQRVSPVERTLTRLNKPDMIGAMKALREDMFNEKVSSYAELKAQGLSDKAIAAHQMLRKAFQDALDVTNDSLRKLGRREITPQEAFMASQWQGQWHVPIKDHNNQLAWVIKAESRAEANKALAWLRKDPELSKTLALDGLEPKYQKGNIGKSVPLDVMGAYQDMLKLFDGDMADHIREAMSAYTEEQGYKFNQHAMHFKNKEKIRGFQGDRPWLSEHDNAMAQAKAQIQYLKEAFRWAPMQEAIANIKEVLSHPELNKQQPNNMALSKAYTAQAMGLSNNIFKKPEQALQELMSGMKYGIHNVLPSNIGKFVGSLKNMTYLQLLGLSPGYMIATPLQAFLLGPARHLQLTGQGFTHSALQTSIKALYDFSVGLTGHSAQSTMRMPMSSLGREAFRYMEDNGIISQNIFHEQSGLGQYAVTRALEKTVGLTISFPEKVARAATFMSFVHHLDASGKMASKAELFRRAEELTNHTLTDFRRSSRPLIVDTLGQAGELAYTFKSPVFNQYNNLSEFARDAMKGKWGPLASALGMTALLGGAVSLPFVNEADSAWQLFKSALAKTWPEHYPAASGLGVKGSIISKMNEVAANDKMQEIFGKSGARFAGDTGAYGAVSAATGSQMASRFSSAIGDVKDPLSQVAPAAQEIKEWAGAAHGLANPNRTNILQGIHTALAPPLIKGQMETHLDDFKTVKQKGGQGYANANKIAEHATSYIRSPEEETKRKFGMTSLQEATTKSARYINQEESANFKNAQEASMDKMFDRAVNHDKEGVQKYARAYFANNGDGDGFERDLDKKLDAYMFSPEQRAIIKAQTISAVKNVVRMRKMQGANANQP